MKTAHRPGTHLSETYQFLLDGIHSGTYEIGTLLPSLRELSEKFQTSRAPIHQAILRLSEEGLVKRMHGKGVEVIRNISLFEKRKRKASVMVITSLAQNPLPASPSSLRHLLQGLDEWLLWYLAQESSIQMQAMFVKSPSELSERLEECLISTPKVLVFARPETIDDKSKELILKLKSHGTHVIHLSNRVRIEGIDEVESDFTQGQYNLTRHAISLGHKRILRFRTQGALNYEERKEAGFRLALQENPSVTGETCIIPPFSSAEEEIHFYKNNLPEHLRGLFLKFKPDCIMGINDVQATLLHLALDSLPYPRPFITGYDMIWDEINWDALLSNPALVKKVKKMNPPTTVDTKIPEISKALSQLAIHRALDKLPPSPQSALISTELVIR